MSDFVPVDQRERDRIRDDLDTNFLVEAGAGSGKTTSLVDRILSHVRRGTPIEQVAAVTFTRKAATELRERLEERLERHLAADPHDERVARAREQLPRAFLGTIHAFCARLLREHPLEAGLDPTFEEVAEEEWPGLRQEFWGRWLERTRRDGDAALDALREAGIDPRVLLDPFAEVCRYPDVSFPTGATPAPDIAPCRRVLEELLALADQLAPPDEPEAGWDKLQRTVRRLRFLRRTGDWTRVPSFCDAIASLAEGNCKVTQNRWAADSEGKKRAKALGEAWLAFIDGPAATTLREWREHRYPLVMDFCLRAANAFEQERRATGRLGFEDLLLGAAGLLRTRPEVRRASGERYRYLLVDEFQDTDPVQAEVCFLLASEPGEGNDWRTVRPRAGALFVVGDPKQSIYRFRRADVQTYDLVRRRLAECGEVLRLVQNFRSVHPIGAFVDAQFEGVFPAEPSEVQAAFAPLRTKDAPAGHDGVYYFAPSSAKKQDDVIADCGARVGSWIAARIAGGEKRAGDFLILTWHRKGLAAYARALAERNVAVAVTGAGLSQAEELDELVLVLRALADPANPVLVAAVLEGILFGCTPADLYDARTAGCDFALTHEPAESGSVLGRALARLHQWWIASQRLPADLVLERILDDSGLLPYAAGRELGENRAGALLHLVEAVRAASLDGGRLAAAIETIERITASAETDSPLRPGRTDAVRVMNLHKAKGLEADVVVLAAPYGLSEHEVTAHVRRQASGTADGGLLICADAAVLAQPPGWSDMAAREALFLEAERERLRYVAATRARRELVIAQHSDKAAWAPFSRALLTHGKALVLEPTDPPGRAGLELPPAALRARADEAATRRTAAARAALVVRTVTGTARDERQQVRNAESPLAGLGSAWGRAVHRTIEAMGRGRAGAALDAFARAVVHDEALEPQDADRLMELMRQLEVRPEWRALVSGERPFFELAMMRAEQGDAVTVVTEGFADAAARSPDGRWTVLDWKTDAATGPEWERRRAGYEAQVASYAAIVAALTGGAGEGRLVRVGAV